MDGMYGTQSDHAHWDLLSLDIWLCVLWILSSTVLDQEHFDLHSISPSLPNLCFLLQSATKQAETLHPKLGFFYILLNSSGGSIAFPSSSPPCNVVPMFKLPIENNKHPNFERRGQGRSANSFVLWSYPIWVQCSYRITRTMKLKRTRKKNLHVCEVFQDEKIQSYEHC